MSDNSKEMIFKSLENLSIQNLNDCKEIGHSEEILDNMSEEEKIKNSAKKLQKDNPILTECQAISVAKGSVSLDVALERSKKVNRK